MISFIPKSMSSMKSMLNFLQTNKEKVKASHNHIYKLLILG